MDRCWNKRKFECFKKNDELMKDTIAIIPARKNSKRLKNKNIKNFMGKPLIYYSILAAMKSNFISEVVVSTDCEKIKKISEKYGAIVPYLRDKKLSDDNSTTIEVIKDLYKKYIAKKKTIKKIIFLQPTSPLRDYKDINKSINFFNLKKADYVTSLCETKPKSWFVRINPDKSLDKNLINKKNYQNKYYLLNGAIYIFKCSLFKKYLKVKRPYAYVMDKKKFIDIDNEFDFELAKFIKKKIKC